ncbi:MAG: class B sortase [Oscillospiraceae bacterium]|nr:class B sortase [Oscillospiraceae bacterium]
MRISRFFLRAGNALLSFFIVLALLLAGSWAAYALWDNNQVYTAAEDVQEALLKLKPVVDEDGDGGASFDELLAINEDVCAWITMDGTAIDYPIVQGENILSYINTDVYGNFALAGSIFLDPANTTDFRDAYCLIYGHHMENSKMFGDLELYEDEEFFAENTTGTLILPDRSYSLTVLACMVISASEDAIFSPDQWFEDTSGLLDFAEENALCLSESVLSAARATDGLQLLALSTCSSDYTDARTVVLTVMTPN